MVKIGCTPQVLLTSALVVACGGEVQDGTTLPGAGSGAMSDQAVPAGETGSAMDLGGELLAEAEPLPSDGDGVSVPGVREGVDLNSDNACAGETREAELLAPVIQVVADTSGSMESDVSGSRLNRWQVTQLAFQSAIDSMPDSTSLGMMFYPYPPDYQGATVLGNDNSSNCNQNPDAPVFAGVEAVPVAPLDGVQRDAVSDILGEVDPEGGTPTHAAYRFGAESLRAGTLEGDQYLLLITDGIPTYGLEVDGDGDLQCTGNGRNTPNIEIDVAPLIDEVEQAAADGIRTFVIGSPGSEPSRELLSTMAQAGGTATDPDCSHDGPNYCHFDMTDEPNFAEALNEALGTIAGLTRSCTYTVPEAPDGRTLDLDNVSVSLIPSSGAESTTIPRDLDRSCAAGWHFIENDTAIELCGSFCEQSKADPSALVEILFGCAGPVVQAR